MIIVIADDLTGAVELGGIGLRYGLTAEVQTELELDTDAELLIIDTDSRSCSPAYAVEKVKNVAKQIENRGQSWIYKKTDSVLRGNVRAELQALRNVFGQKTILLIPANPSFGRTISDGNYFIRNKPLHKTDFANDPEHPIRSSNVLHLLEPYSESDIRFVKRGHAVPKCDIVVGEAETQDDLLKWAYKTNSQILPAGGSDFFDTLLRVMGMYPEPVEIPDSFISGDAVLIVCGSASEYSRKIVAQARKQGRAVCDMPEQLFTLNNDESKFLEYWTTNVLEAFHENKKVIVAINHPVVQNFELSKKLARNMAALVKNVLSQTEIKQLIVEGGATSTTIVRRNGWKKFYPIHEIKAGIVRLQVAENPKLNLTIKPGSYPWHDDIFY